MLLLRGPLYRATIYRQFYDLARSLLPNRDGGGMCALKI